MRSILLLSADVPQLQNNLRYCLALTSDKSTAIQDILKVIFVQYFSGGRNIKEMLNLEALEDTTHDIEKRKWTRWCWKINLWTKQSALQHTELLQSWGKIQVLLDY